MVVPITHVKVRSVRLPPPVPQRTKKPERPQHRSPGGPARGRAAHRDGGERDAERREAELAAKVRSRMQEAERHYSEGNYTEVPAALVKLLTELEPSEAQLVEIYRLLALPMWRWARRSWR